ncbi:MAG: 23S rRNA pseudouridine(1911/1915/1917) synthase RluD [Methylophilaceae bacterium]
MTKIDVNKKLIIPTTFFGSRLDAVLSNLLPEFSRSKIQSMIKNDFIFLNGLNVSQNYKVVGGEEIMINGVIEDEIDVVAQNIPLEIIYEDDDILVLNKPSNFVVHPGSGNTNGTLLNGLIHYNKNLEKLPRGGIVHRLDKDTTGLMVVAKNEESQNNLINQLQSKAVYREYRAIVWGQIWQNKVINKPIGRHPRQRTKMAVTKVNGKSAETSFEVLERFNYHTYVRCLLKTGRTHQIRVHMLDNNSPIVGDKDYGLKKIIPTKKMSDDLLNAIKIFDRQALHAISLGLIHPKTNKEMKWTIDLPEDMKELLSLIRKDSIENDFGPTDHFLQQDFELNDDLTFDDER